MGKFCFPCMLGDTNMYTYVKGELSPDVLVRYARDSITIMTRIIVIMMILILTRCNNVAFFWK